MTAALSTIAVRDGAGATVAGGVQALDQSGTGVGPWSFTHVLLDGAGNGYRGRVNSDGTLAVKIEGVSVTFTIDSELAAATAAADATANPTAPIMQGAMLGYNGTTWDRARVVINGLNSAGTGILASGVVAQFDDTAPGTITENQFGPLRMSVRRELYGQIRDAAGNERGVNVGSDNALRVDPSGTTTQPTKHQAQTTKQLTNASLAFSTSGENTLVSGTAAQTIRVFRLSIVPASSVTITFKDAASGTTLAVYDLQAGQELWFDTFGGGEPLWVTATAGAFIASLSAAVACKGFVQYVKS